MPTTRTRAEALALDPSPFGCNSHLAADTLIASLASIGVRWQRFDVDWNEVEPHRGEFHWGELDRCLTAAARLGVSVYATPAYTPAWASGVADRTAPPRDGADFVSFVRAVVRRYRGRIHALGVWNEPNLRQFYKGTREFYLRELLVPGLRAVRAEAPEITTCGPDLSSSRDVHKWLDAALLAAGDLIDVVTHHQYDGGDTVAGRVRAIERLRDHISGRPLWITETGWMRPGTSDARQSANLRDMLRAMASRAAWWHKTFWYDSHGSGWGLFGADGEPAAGQPLPALFACREVIAELQPQPTPDDVTLGIVVDHAYAGILARAADAGGRADYVRRLRQGLGNGGLCAVLFDSSEFARERAGLPAEEIAAQLYAGILGRAADAGGLAATAAAVRAQRGAERAAEMLDSPEFRERFLAERLAARAQRPAARPVRPRRGTAAARTPAARKSTSGGTAATGRAKSTPSKRKTAVRRAPAGPALERAGRVRARGRRRR